MLITNGKIVTQGENCRILENHAMLIEGNIIQKILPQAELLAEHPDELVLDALGQYVMPGAVCAHTHFYGAFARGMAIPGPAPKDFPEILEKLWWPLDKALDEPAVRLSAQVMLVDAIRNGTTTLFDHHASPNAISGSLDAIAQAVESAGVRAVLCYEVTDRDGQAKAQAGIDENIRFIQAAAQNSTGRLGAIFGLHASLTLSDETLFRCVDAVPYGAGFHIHVAEHEADEYDSLARSGTRVIDRLHRLGILNPKTIVAHAVHIDLREAAILAETGAWVSHQPRSNMNNGVGVAQIEGLARLGVKVCLGTDGFPHSMWEEARFAYMLPKVASRDPRRMPGDLLYRFLVRNNTALADSCFPGQHIGELTEGAVADLVFVDYHPHTPFSPDNLPWHVVFGFHERMVTTTMVAGQLLMHNRQLLTMDEEAIASEARALAPHVWERYRHFVRQ